MTELKRRAVFLDRDGVLNRAVVRGGRPYSISAVEDVEILPGVPEGMRRLKAAGFLLIVVSNQPDVARGAVSKESVEAINAHLASHLPIDRVIMCYHDDDDGCDCRKPCPGMLLLGGRELNVDLKTSFMVGDRWRDMEAGISAGCRTIFIDYGYNEQQPRSYDFRASSLRDASLIICSETSNEKN